MKAEEMFRSYAAKKQEVDLLKFRITNFRGIDADEVIARENAERRAKEKKAAEEKAAERRKEKKAEEEKAAERRAEKKAANEARTEMGEYTVSATGTDIKAVTEKIIAATSGTSAPTGASFEIKA